jgi:hypothetical protein
MTKSSIDMVKAMINPLTMPEGSPEARFSGRPGRAGPPGRWRPRNNGVELAELGMTDKMT